MPDRDEAMRSKYDRLARDRAGLPHSGPYLLARHVWAICDWCRGVPAGSSVLEIGCAGGHLTEQLALRELDMTAIDLSPAMVERAEKRLGAAGLSARFLVGDVNAFEPPQPFDAVVSFRTFFEYSRDPLATLERLTTDAHTVVLDFNPRALRVRDAIDVVRGAGFRRVIWRPLYVPKNHRLPVAVTDLGRGAEVVPGLRRLPLFFKFTALLRGER